MVARTALQCSVKPLNSSAVGGGISIVVLGLAMLRLCGIAGHERSTTGKTWKGAVEGWPVDVHDVFRKVPGLANPMLELAPATGLPTAESLKGFFDCIEVAAGGRISRIQLKAIRAFCAGWGEAPFDPAFKKAFITVRSVDKEEMVDVSAVLSNLAGGATLFKRWLIEVLSLSLECDVVLGLYAAASRGDGGRGVTRDMLRKWGTELRVDPAAFALSVAGRPQRDASGANTSRVVAGVVAVLEWHPGTGKPEIEPYQHQLLGALTVANAWPRRVAGSNGDVAARSPTSMSATMRRCGCAGLTISRAAWRKVLGRAAWALYVLDADAAVPEVALERNLFVVVDTRMYSTALLRVLRALITGALRIVLYPTIEAGVPRVLTHRDGFRCTWRDNLTAPRVNAGSRTVSVLCTAGAVTWGALAHAIGQGVQTVIMAGHTATIAADPRASSVWLDLLYTHGVNGLLAMSSVTMGTALLDASRASRALSARDRGLVHAHAMLATTGGDYSYALKIQETLAAGASPAAAASAADAVTHRNVTLASAWDVVQHLDTRAAEPASPPCKRARQQ